MMLGKTASSIFWMFRDLERSENTARLVEAGFRIALTRAQSQQNEWASVIATAGVARSYESLYSDYEGNQVIDFLLRSPKNPSSVMTTMHNARNNARIARTALTREVWEAVNEAWLRLGKALKDPTGHKELPEILALIRQLSQQVQGALHGTMLRNDIYNFARLGTFTERADNTARILDVKYYVLLPSASSIGSSLDNVQWETILRAVSAERAYRWLYSDEISPSSIADFLILDKRLPRSLVFCVEKVLSHLGQLDIVYGQTSESHNHAYELLKKMSNKTIDEIFETGLHEFITGFLRNNNALASCIETDYRFLK